MLHRVILIVVMILAGIQGFAQSVAGYVKDEKTKESLPFVNVWIKGTLQRTVTDSKGWYRISTPKNDTLCISSVGYITQEIRIKPTANNTVNIWMKEVMENIDEVVVKPDVPRAKVIFNQIQKHKKENRERILSVNDYKTLENTTVYIAVDTASQIIRSFGNLNDVTVKIKDQDLRFSPVYLSELAQDVRPDSVRTVYQKKDGIFPRLNQIFETLVLKSVIANLDFYKDQIFILDRGFISPLNNLSMLHYNLYLNDSTMVDSTKYFNFSFTPKNKYNQLFSGHFVIEDKSFALTAIDVYIPKEANLNFVNGFEGHVRYKKTPETGWFYDEQNVGINLATKINKDSVSNYSSKRMDRVTTGNCLINKTTRYSTATRLDQVKASTWKSQPEFNLHQLETDPYARVDKLKEHKVIKGIDKVGGMALTSYINAGQLDIGPVFDIYSSNYIEGKRFSVPVRTSEKWCDRFSIGGFLGYGTKSNEIKYGFDLGYQPLKTDKFIFRFNYSDDYITVAHDKYLRFIKNNPNNRGNGNFIAVVTSREDNPYLKEEKSYEFMAEYNSFSGVHLEVQPYLLASTSNPYVKFIQKGIDYNQYKNYGVLMDLRLTFGQHYDKYFFDRVYYVNPIPVVNLCADIGQTLLPGASMKNAGLYTQFHGSIQGRINMGQIFMNYIVNAGYLFGDAPYDLLDQPVGSMSLGYAKDRYNLLHFAAFAHNVYTNTHLHFNGGGVILNRIPVVKKFKLREIVSLKCHYGTLNSDYKGVFDLPDYYHNEIKKPYAEIGFGVTNVFKVLRIEYVHQLGSTYLNRSFTDNGGLRLRAEMSF